MKKNIIKVIEIFNLYIEKLKKKFYALLVKRAVTFFVIPLKSEIYTNIHSWINLVDFQDRFGPLIMYSMNVPRRPTFRIAHRFVSKNSLPFLNVLFAQYITVYIDDHRKRTLMDGKERLAIFETKRRR